eukprot:2294964-Amphidinium_carterae.5
MAELIFCGVENGKQINDPSFSIVPGLHGRLTMPCVFDLLESCKQQACDLLEPYTGLAYRAYFYRLWDQK